MTPKVVIDMFYVLDGYVDRGPTTARPSARPPRRNLHVFGLYTSGPDDGNSGCSTCRGRHTKTSQPHGSRRAAAFIFRAAWP